MAGQYNLKVDAGTTHRLLLAFHRDTGVLDVDGLAVYQPYDFIGAAIAMQVRCEPGGTVLAEVSTVDGSIVLGDPGELTITLTAEQTANLTRGRYDIRCQYPSGDVVRLLEGSVTVSEQITEVTA